MSPATRPALAALLVLLAIVSSATAGEVGNEAPAEEDLLRPSPFGSADEAIRDLRRRKLRSAAEGALDRPEDGLRSVESPPRREGPGTKDVTVTGAVTVIEGGRLGFMPVLLHHMAVEHWFLAGLDAEQLRAALGGGKRCYVKLRGRRELKGVWSPQGGEGLDWYGNGLSHGPTWGRADGQGGAGGVMGYHERVYELEVQQLVWAHRPAEYARLRDDFGAARVEVYRFLDAGQHARALEALERCSPIAGDVGVWHWDSAELREMLLDLLAAGEPPERWDEAAVARLAGALVRASGSGWPWDRQKIGRTRLEAAMARWPKEARARLAAEGARRWRELEYRHQKEALMELLASLGGPEVERLRAETAAAGARLKALRSEIDELAGGDDYERLARAMDEAAPLQPLVRDYEMERRLTPERRRHVEECRDFARQWRDGSARPAAVREALGRLLSPSRTDRGDADSEVRPRLCSELAARFLPRLDQEERAGLSHLAAELSGTLELDARHAGEKALVLAELLAGLDTAEARAQLTRLIGRRRRAGAPEPELRRLAELAGRASQQN